MVLKPLIPTPGRHKEVNLWGLGASPVYKASSKTVRAVIQKNPISKKKKAKTNPTRTTVFLIEVIY